MSGCSSTRKRIPRSRSDVANPTATASRSGASARRNTSATTSAVMLSPASLLVVCRHGVWLPVRVGQRMGSIGGRRSRRLLIRIMHCKICFVWHRPIVIFLGQRSSRRWLFVRAYRWRRHDVPSVCNACTCTVQLLLVRIPWRRRSRLQWLRRSMRWPSLLISLVPGKRWWDVFGQSNHSPIPIACTAALVADTPWPCTCSCTCTSSHSAAIRSAGQCSSFGVAMVSPSTAAAADNAAG